MLPKELAEDFRKFLYVVWKHLGLPAPTPVQYEIANWLQGGPRRKIIEGYRGIGKSWITSAYVCWAGANDPDQKFLVVSASKTRSDDFSTFTQRLITELPYLNFLLPKSDQRFSKVAFDFGPARAAHAPSVKSVGIFGQLTGSRATEIIADDIEVAQNSVTQDMREKLLKAVMEFEAIIVPKVGKITYLGTPQTEESVYNTLRKRGYEARIWPARFPSSASTLENYGGALAPSLVRALERSSSLHGEPTDPARFNDVELLEREASYGRSGFMLQFMLDTSLSDAQKYPLKTSDLICMHLNTESAPTSIQYASSVDLQIKELPCIGFSGDRFYRPMYFEREKLAPYEGSVMSIDPSGRGSDEMGYAVVKQRHGQLFALDFGGLKGGYEEDNLVLLSKLAKTHKVNSIIIEANFGDGMFTKIFTPVLLKHYKCAVEEVKHSTQKEKRIIDTLEPVLNQHRLVMDIEAIKRDLKELQDAPSPVYSLLYQLTRLTKDRGALKHDDRLDALAIAVAYWLEAMAKDEAKSLQVHRDREMDKALKMFMKGTTYTGPLVYIATPGKDGRTGARSTMTVSLASSGGGLNKKVWSKLR